MANPLINRVLRGQYRVTEFIAVGGMGAVYKVYDLTKNVYLAMKVLNLDVEDDPGLIRYFKREANAYRNLSHPNIVPFYGLEQTDEMLFILQKFIDGDSLKGILARQKGKVLPVKETLAVMKALCASLGYAHYKGVVHCDVKPGNVLVDMGGNIFLTDFGIARHAESTTTSIAEAGTVAYMSPEQIRSESVFPETDIYGLGVVLFELLTGQRPFRGRESNTDRQVSVREQLRAAHLNELPPDPSSLQPEIPEAAAQVVLKALAKDPKERFHHTQEMFDALCSAYHTTSEGAPDRISPSLVETVEAVPGEEAGKPADDNAIAQGKENEEHQSIFPSLIRRVPVWLVGVMGLAVLSAIVLSLFLPGGNEGGREQVRSVASLTTFTADTLSSSESNTDVPTELPSTKSPTKTTIPPTNTPTEEPTRLPQAGDTKLGLYDITLVYVPAGEFLMGTNQSDPYAGEAKFKDEQPQHIVYVDGFWMFESEVTNAMFTKFVQATGYRTTAEQKGVGYNVRMDSEASRETPGATWRNPYGTGVDVSQMGDYPVTQVSWYDAQSYCEWVNGRLPTEAEWEKAARGENGNLYPWGNQALTGNYANSADVALGSDFWSDRSVNDGFRLAAPVKSFPDGVSPYGLYDMAGNVWEWVADWYTPDGYSATRVINPTGPNNGEKKVLRGGSYINGKKNVRAARRGSIAPEISLDVYGFRCVVP